MYEIHNKEHEHLWVGKRKGSSYLWVIDGCRVYNANKSTLRESSQDLIKQRLYKVVGIDADNAVENYLNYLKDHNLPINQHSKVSNRLAQLQKQIDNKCYQTTERKIVFDKSQLNRRTNNTRNSKTSSDRSIPFSTFFKAFGIILVVNQIQYGFCFSAYCIIAAFPHVFIMALLVTIAIFFIKKS